MFLCETRTGSQHKVDEKHIKLARAAHMQEWTTFHCRFMEQSWFVSTYRIMKRKQFLSNHSEWMIWRNGIYCSSPQNNDTLPKTFRAQFQFDNLHDYFNGTGGWSGLNVSLKQLYKYLIYIYICYHINRQGNAAQPIIYKLHKTTVFVFTTSN